jgi:LacI family transcriptional regulator
MMEILRNDSLKGIFVSTSKGTAVAASFVEGHGKNDVRVIGYDILQDNLKYLRSGAIDFLINQNPKRQGVAWNKPSCKPLDV